MTAKPPIFQSIFAEHWATLPPVMLKHYANRPFSKDIITAKGFMDISFAPIIKWLSPLLRIFGSLVPYQGQNIPVTVHFRSEADSNAFCLDRRFHFHDRKPYTFFSRMVPVKDNVLIEFMKYGLGWKHRYSFENDKVLLKHEGYVLKLWGLVIRLPLEWFVGKGDAEEQALSNNRFKMKMTLKHFLFGQMYEYRGEFEVVDE